MSHTGFKKRALTGPLLICSVFCAVSGGPYGLEPLIKESGAGMALVLILLTPLLWALPDALTTAELAAAIPEEGGYVVWVRRAMGPFAAFLNAWWTWLYSLVDAAIYPVLFAQYLNAMLKAGFGSDALERGLSIPLGLRVPGLDHLTAADTMATLFIPNKWLVAAMAVVLLVALNIRGTRLVGLTSTAFAVALIVPFVAMSVVGLWRLGFNPQPIVREFIPSGMTPLGSIQAGLAVVMWNYLGWDILSTVAEEVDKPEKNYPLAMMVGVPLVTLTYLLPTVVGLAYSPNIAGWENGAWPAIARAAAGDAVGWMVTIGGLISPLALFVASVLGATRLPFVLAEDGFLPKGLVKLHPKFGTPYRAILVCGVVYLALIQFSFLELAGINVVLYAFALVTETLALVILRRKEPDLPRPFRIRGGMPVLILIFLCPTLLAGFLVWSGFAEYRSWQEALQGEALTLSAILSAPLIYWGIKLVRDYQADDSRQ